MSEEKPETDVEKQESFFSENLMEKVKKKRIPDISGSVILVYAILSAMFVVGWVSLNSCSINKMIPIYLIVAGATGILTKLLITTDNRHVFNIVLVLFTFDLFWQGLGSYFVYKEYQPNYDPIKGPYCNRYAYLLAFWTITMQYVLLSLFLLLSLCYLLMKGDFKT